MGFAYDVFGTGRTILRGGYGISWSNPFTGGSGSKTKNPPFLLSTALTTTLLPTLRFDNGIPPPPPVDFTSPPQGSARSLFDIRDADGYAQQWNVNIQHQLGRDFMVESGVCRHARNTPDDEAGHQSGAGHVRRDQFGRESALYQHFAAAAWFVGSSEPWLVGISIRSQVKVTKRFARSFMMLSSYTYSQVI